MKVFFRRKGEILKGLYKKLRFHMNFCSGIRKPRLDPSSFVKTRRYHTQMLLYGKPASHILVEQPIGPCWYIQGSQTHKGIQLCENNFREHPFYYEGFLLPSFLLFLTLKTNPEPNQLLDTNSDETGFSEPANLNQHKYHPK